MGTYINQCNKYVIVIQGHLKEIYEIVMNLTKHQSKWQAGYNYDA